MYRLTSWRAKRNLGCGRRCPTLESLPVTRLSRQRISQPLSSLKSQRCEPRKPAPPVITARKLFSPEPAGVFAASYYRRDFFTALLQLICPISIVFDFGAAAGFAKAVLWSMTIRQPSENFLKLRVNTPDR